MDRKLAVSVLQLIFLSLFLVSNWQWYIQNVWEVFNSQIFIAAINGYVSSTNVCFHADKQTDQMGNQCFATNFFLPYS